MLKQTDIPAEDQAEVFRIADKLYREDEEHRRNADASAEAAGELGIPKEYLDRAAQELHLQRLDAVNRKRNRNRVFVAAVIGVGLVTASILSVTLSRVPAPPSPVAMATASVTNVYDLSSASVRANSESKGSIIANNSGATLQIEQFVPDIKGDFYGNILLPAGNVQEVEAINAQVAGNGIPNVRIDLEAGDVRWKGPVSPTGTSIAISAKEFQRQVRTGSSWKNTAWQPPSGALKIAFKTGKTINDVSSRGTLTVTNVELRAKQ
ncbi:MAG: hypothetical protein ACKO14_13590 [Armatimonadota bacterium]